MFEVTKTQSRMIELYCIVLASQVFSKPVEHHQQLSPWPVCCAGPAQNFELLHVTPLLLPFRYALPPSPDWHLSCGLTAWGSCHALARTPPQSSDAWQSSSSSSLWRACACRSGSWTWVLSGCSQDWQGRSSGLQVWKPATGLTNPLVTFWISMVLRMATWINIT